MKHDRPEGYRNGYLYVYWRGVGMTQHWHETYQVTPGTYEAIYGGMPRFGLAAAGDHIPIEAATNTARTRLDDKPSLP
ncbi:MAG: monooxygenase family protein [Mycobacterium sp.]